jgi:hypothetical protein
VRSYLSLLYGGVVMVVDNEVGFEKKNGVWVCVGIGISRISG